jgi:acyl carrier protein
MKFTREKVREELVAILGSHAQTGAQVKDSSHLVGDLGIDSLGLAETVADIEDKFQIAIPDEALRDYDTVASVARAIEAKLQKDGRLEG